MRRLGIVRKIVLAAALAALPALSLAIEEQTLLTADGTVHVVRAGRAIDLGIQDATLSPEDASSSGPRGPDERCPSPSFRHRVRGAKRGPPGAFDERDATLLLLVPRHLGVLPDPRRRSPLRRVTNSGLLPNRHLAAFNPQMRVTPRPSAPQRPDVPSPDELDSLHHLVGGASTPGALLAFPGRECFRPGEPVDLRLPVLTGGGGAELSREGIAAGAICSESPDRRLTGAFLISYADLHDQRHKVVRVQFPDDQGKPSEPGNLKWQRRHIPIVGIASSGPIARMAPSLEQNAGMETGTGMSVGTSIGSGYVPTLYWRDGEFLKYSRLEGADWSAVRSIAIDAVMTYEKALALVTGMGARN